MSWDLRAPIDSGCIELCPNTPLKIVFPWADYMCVTERREYSWWLSYVVYENTSLEIVFPMCARSREYSWWLSYVHTCATAHLMEWGLTGISFINCN